MSTPGKWAIVLIHRPGIDSLKRPTWTEAMLKRRFRTKAEAVLWAREHFGRSKFDRAGWRVERQG